MGGAVGNAIGILYGSHPPRQLVYFYSSIGFLLGLLWFYRAYSKPFDVRPFRVRDLFSTIWTPPKMNGPTKTQLWIEGVFLIVISIVTLLVFRSSN
jgi:hypothetical protein